MIWIFLGASIIGAFVIACLVTMWRQDRRATIFALVFMIGVLAIVCGSAYSIVYGLNQIGVK